MIRHLWFITCLGLGGCASTAPAPPSPSPVVTASAALPASADEAILKVNELNRAGKFSEAATVASAGLKAFPKNWMLLANRGSSYLYLNNPEAARQDFSAALELSTPEAKGTLLSQRGRAEAMRGRAAAAEKDFAAAQKLLNSQSDPVLTAQLWRLRGMNLLSDLRPKESLVCLEQSLKINPDQPAVLGARALAYSQLHDTAHFQADMKRLRKLDPAIAKQVQEDANSTMSPAEELGKAGTLKLRGGDNEGAIASLTRAIALNPRYALAYQKRGSALQNLNRFSEAARDYTTSYNLDHNEVALFNRASCYSSMNKNAQARADLEKFLTIGKDEAALKMARSALQNLNR